MYLRRGDIIKLPSFVEGQCVIVTLIEDRYKDKDIYPWKCMVVGGNNPNYPVGGYDIVVSDKELMAGEKVIL